MIIQISWGKFQWVEYWVKDFTFKSINTDCQITLEDPFSKHILKYFFQNLKQLFFLFAFLIEKNFPFLKEKAMKLSRELSLSGYYFKI